MDEYTEPHVPPAKSASRQNIPRSRNSITSAADEQPHIGNYRLQKTIGKGNFAKVKLARHVLTGREVSFRGPCSLDLLGLVGKHFLSMLGDKHQVQGSQH